MNQTYCVPGTQQPFEREVSGSLGIETCPISMDQEKDYDWVEHQYL